MKPAKAGNSLDPGLWRTIPQATYTLLEVRSSEGVEAIAARTEKWLRDWNGMAVAAMPLGLDGGSQSSVPHCMRQEGSLEQKVSVFGPLYLAFGHEFRLSNDELRCRFLGIWRIAIFC